jgi:hypothetical protein
LINCNKPEPKIREKDNRPRKKISAKHFNEKNLEDKGKALQKTFKISVDIAIFNMNYPLQCVSNATETQ